MTDAAMRPPASRPDATPMSNSDFRQYLDTPRRDRPGARQQKPKPDADQDSAQASKKASRARKYKPQQQETEEAEGPGYRDRAEERRKGFNPDYEQAELKSATGADLATLSVEDTKFLGGDVEHTHLVKGLDYALLTKVKEEQVRVPVTAKETQAKARAVKQGPVFATSIGKAVYSILFDAPSAEPFMAFQPNRMAFQYDLDDPAAPDVPTTNRRSEADCPKLVDSLVGTLDAPVLERLAKVLSFVRISGKNGKKLKRKDKLRMLEAMEQAQLGGPSNGSVPHAANGDSAQPPLPSEVKLEPEIDLFGDDGADYQLQPRAAAPDRAQDTSYFDQPESYADLPALPSGTAGDDDMELDDGGVPPPPPPPPGPPEDMVGPARPPDGYDVQAAYAQPDAYAQPETYNAYMQASIAQQASQDPEYQALMAQQQGMEAFPLPPPPPPEAPEMTQQDREAGLASVFKPHDPQTSRKEADARERDPSYISDAYAECYPGYHSYATAVVDSDDEDLSHMDSKDRGKARTDFETEEQWQAYKGSKEAAPKAAFQFGVKVSGGRKNHKDLALKGREQKENTQLNKIQQILERDGGDFAAEFAAKPAEESGPAPVKKRRI